MSFKKLVLSSIYFTPILTYLHNFLPVKQKSEEIYFLSKEYKCLFMIRVKVSYHNSLLFKVFQVYRIVLLFCRSVSIRFIFIDLFYSSHWRSMTPKKMSYLEFNINLSKTRIFVIFCFKWDK